MERTQDSLHESNRPDLFKSDIFNISPPQYKIRIIIHTLYKFIHDESSSVSKFREEISLKHLIRRLRIGIRLTTFSVLLGFMELSLLSTRLTKMHTAFILFTIFVNGFLYWQTTRIASPHICFKISFVLMIQSIALYLIMVAKDTLSHETAFIPGTLLLVFLCFFLPLRNDIVLATLVLYASSFILIGSIPGYMASDEDFEFHSNQSKTIHVYSFIVSLLTEVIAINSGVHLRIWHTTRWQCAFLYLAEAANVHLNTIHWQNKQRLIMKELLPRYFLSQSTAVDRLKHVVNPDDTYLETFVGQTVSVMRAELFGLSKFVPHTSVTEQIRLLHKLLCILDRLTEKVGCERLDVYGNIYLAMAGIGSTRKDPAQMCVELGLIICYTIKRLTREDKRPLTVRVGIHTTQNTCCALMGLVRSHIDLFSNDLALLERLQTSCLTGRVHVSEAVYRRCLDKFRFAEGDSLESGEEVDGQTQLIKTYYVDPRSNSLLDLRLDSDEISRVVREPLDRLINIVKNTSIPPQASNIKLPQKRTGFSAIGSQVTDHMFRLNKQSIQHFICNVQMAPQRFRSQYAVAPVNYRNFCFHETEVERQFRNQHKDDEGRHFLDSDKLTMVIDSISLTVHLILIFFIGCLIIKPAGVRILTCSLLWLFLCGSQVVLVGILIRMTLFPISERLLGRILNLMLTHSSIREVVVFVQTLLPTACLVIFIFGFSSKEMSDVQAKKLLTSLETLVYMTHILATGSRFVLRIAGLICSVSIVFVCNLCIFILDEQDCEDKRLLDSDNSYDQHLSIHWLQIPFIWLLVWFCSRESDLVYRIMFYQRRKANMETKKLNVVLNGAKRMLHAFIPPQLCDHFTMVQEDKREISRDLGQFWLEACNAGIGMFSVTNFRSLYETNDTKQGLHFVHQLNQLICTFDRLLSQPTFQDVEKIKSFQHYYLVSAGLWLTANEQADMQAHLISLMEYCLLALHVLKQFNEENFTNQSGFKMTIGYHTGVVFAGVSGYSRLAFNAWGNTVDMAQRLMQCELVDDQILVHKATTLLLSHRYQFKLIGQLFIDSDDPVTVYTCSAKDYP